MNPARINRELALKAVRLAHRNVVGDELAVRLKVEPEQALALVKAGVLIQRAEDTKLKQREWDVLKVVVRVLAQNILLGRDFAKTGDVNFAAGKRSGWCTKQIPTLTVIGLVEMADADKIRLTKAGWVLAWETGLIKPNWKVPA